MGFKKYKTFSSHTAVRLGNHSRTTRVIICSSLFLESIVPAKKQKITTIAALMMRIAAATEAKIANFLASIPKIVCLLGYMIVIIGSY